MNALNRFLTGVFVVLLVILAGLWLWQKERRPSEPSAPQLVASHPTTVAALTTSPAVRQQLQAALDLQTQHKLVPSRDALRQWIEGNPGSDLVGEAEKALGDIDIQIVMTPAPAPEKVDYTIQPGDSLDRIARRFNTTIELLEKSNHLPGATIHPGDRLRVYQGKFSVIVDKTANTLTLLDNNKLFKIYRCGTGQYNLTPVGEWKIVDRIPNPAWWKDGKVIPFGDTNNVLGTYWLKLDVPGYGIHGTWEPDSIGKQSSQGCVRLINDDVAELFLLLPYGTPVSIHD